MRRLGRIGRLGLNRARSQGPAVLVVSGLVAEWRFDDGSGQVLTDYSGNGWHGQLGTTTGVEASDPTWNAGPWLDFDGGDRIQTTGFPQLLAARTISIVFRATSLAALSILASTSDVGSGGYRFYLNTNGTLTATHQPSNSMVVQSATGAIVTGTDYAATFTFDSTNGARLYLNSVQVATSAQTAQPVTDGSLMLGHRFHGFPFTGRMYYGVVYDRALTQGEVSTNYSFLKNSLALRGITLP